MDYLKIIIDSISNFLTRKKLIYVVESNNWSIKWDGFYVTQAINQSKKMKAKISTSRFLLRNKIVHFGSVGSLIDAAGIKKVHPSNKIICTWFHVSPDDKRNKFIPNLNTKVDVVHTSCEISKNELIKYGLKPEKIVIAPIGIDLDIFKQYNEEKRQKARKTLNIPDNKTVIGLFQKDGVGWGEGNEAKLIKGPDIFCDVIEQLAKEYNIHVLLTGPARGYVKKRLVEASVPFTHHYLKKYYDIVDYYNALDLYLLTSRVEGGPKAITESMACGVSIVSTKMGMAPEIINHAENGLLSEVDDIDSLLTNCKIVIENKSFRQQMVHTALIDVKKYSWIRVAKQLYDEIYSQLL